MRKQPNYQYLVLGLSAAIAVIAATGPVNPLGIAGVAGSAVLLVVTAYLVAERKRQVIATVALGAFALLPLAWFGLYPATLPLRLAKGIYTVDLVFWLLFTITTTLIVFRGIMTASRVRANEIYGAIYVYLLIGVFFAQGYQLLLAIQPDALYFEAERFGAPQSVGSGLLVRSPGDLVYFSFVSLGTVGSGDVTPASRLARAVSMVEGLIGVMYVATMIARFVSIQTSGGPGGEEPI